MKVKIMNNNRMYFLVTLRKSEWVKVLNSDNKYSNTIYLCDLPDESEMSEFSICPVNIQPLEYKHGGLIASSKYLESAKIIEVQHINKHLVFISKGALNIDMTIQIEIVLKNGEDKDTQIAELIDLEQ